MKVVIGSDHAGFVLKSWLSERISAKGHEIMDVGAWNTDSSDYPDYAVLAGRAVVEGLAEIGVLVCGTGVGISIAANKVMGIRAAAVSDPVTARLSRSHNDANIVCVGSRIIGEEVAGEIIDVFLATAFSQGERHVRRLQKVAKLEFDPDADPFA